MRSGPLKGRARPVLRVTSCRSGRTTTGNGNGEAGRHSVSGAWGMLSAFSYPFATLFAEPPRNGLTRPKTVRGSGVKMVNMGEIFDHPRLNNVPMERVPLNRSERSRGPCGLLQDGDLLFDETVSVSRSGRRDKCSIFLEDHEPTTCHLSLTSPASGSTSPIMGRPVANVHTNLTLEALRDALLTSHGYVSVSMKVGLDDPEYR